MVGSRIHNDAMFSAVPISIDGEIPNYCDDLVNSDEFDIAYLLYYTYIYICTSQYNSSFFVQGLTNWNVLKTKTKLKYRPQGFEMCQIINNCIHIQ